MNDEPDNSPEERQRIMELLATARPGWMDDQIVPSSRPDIVGDDVTDVGSGSVLVDVDDPPPQTKELPAVMDGGTLYLASVDGDLEWRFVEPGDFPGGGTGSLTYTVDGSSAVELFTWEDGLIQEDGVFDITIPLPEDGVDGEDGQEVEVGIDEGYISWRYVTDPVSAWIPLVALEDLKGDEGDPGVTPTITFNDVESLEPEHAPYIEEDVTSAPPAYVFNLGIPKGEKGDPGDFPGGATGSLEIKDCEDNIILTLEWVDGLITAPSGSHFIDAGCSEPPSSS